MLSEKYKTYNRKLIVWVQFWVKSLVCHIPGSKADSDSDSENMQHDVYKDKL